MGHDTVLIQRRRESGQAIIMVTLALIAMCGMLGLAVDFGWAFFVKRSAQAAADQAALAAVTEIRRLQGGAGNDTFPCRTNGGCAENLACDATLLINDPFQNLDNACLYAKQAGFEHRGRQQVLISEGSIADGRPVAPTLPGGGFPLQYWATVRVTETVPQLFSAILGNPMAVVSARATAGIYLEPMQGAIVLLNRDLDEVDGGNAGANLVLSGNSNVEAGGTIFLASACAGNCGSKGKGTWAGQLGGNSSSVDAPFTLIRGSGWVTDNTGKPYQQPPPGTLSSQIPWDAHPQNGAGDGPEFRDPTESIAQVPADNGGLPDCAIPEGLIGGPDDGQGAWYLGPGNYYATTVEPPNCKTGCRTVANGQQLTVMGNVKFVNSGTCVHRNGVESTSTFGTHVFFGGMKMGNGANISFDPGKMVLAGVWEESATKAGVLLDIRTGGSEASLVSNRDSNSAGNIFIFTAPDVGYPGLVTPTFNKSVLWNSLKQGRVELKSGRNNSVTIDLWGLRSMGSGFPPELKPYDGTVFWQDRRNSTVSYTDLGRYNCSPPYVSGCGKSIGTDKTTPSSPEFALSAGAFVGLHGVLYQPRGAWASFSGSGNLANQVQIITGALLVEDGALLKMIPTPTTMPRARVALVE